MHSRVLIIFSLIFTLITASSALMAQDTLTVWRMLDQAARIDTVDRAKDKYETAYTMAKQLDYDRGVLASIEKLIPLELDQEKHLQCFKVFVGRGKAPGK